MGTRHLKNDSETAEFARQIATLVGAGDILLLDGPVGAGKTAFSRALIQSLLPVPEDVPSPTFTLVQTYDTPDFEIWHCDLYRLTSPDEVFELGLDDAFTQALCLIEWPDRLDGTVPKDATTLSFDYADVDSRTVRVSGTKPWVKHV